MSFHEQNLQAFIELLTDVRSRRLFTEKHLEELAQIVAPVPDDTEQLSIAIATWYEQHPTIADAQLAFLNELLSPSVPSPQTVNPVASERLPGSKQPTLKPPQIQLNKQTLQNAIHTSSSDNSSPLENSKQ
ncbi:MAG: hypothetical protein F6K32_22280 [Desertifilum sp. SIO1I2]|nr:hypothetical protein [Desertifilum sp. SIO1I2]